VILAGGSGTRLWPASRRARPKQFLALGDRPGESLLAATVRRARGAATGDVCAVTAAAQADLARTGVPGLEVIAEPVGRNTAAALGLAAVHLLARDPDAVMGALPADQHVGDEAAFAVAIERAFQAAAQADVICTIGIEPSYGATGFGYLEVGDAVESGIRDLYQVKRFVEKPDAATAEGYVTSGRYLWNSGMFFCKARRLVDDIRRLMPGTGAALDEIAAALASGGAVAADAVAARVYPSLPSVSIDHGVMEKTSGVVCVRGELGWDDVGSWAALPAVRGADADGNTVLGDAIVVDGTGNVVAADPDRVVVLVGVSDLVVIQSGDAVLVVPRERAQDVRLAVDALAARGQGRFL
jgi:mannose-1-phosphate guanylyltransferase